MAETLQFTQPRCPEEVKDFLFSSVFFGNLLEVVLDFVLWYEIFVFCIFTLAGFVVFSLLLFLCFGSIF